MANRLNKIHFEKKHNLQSFLYRSMRQPSIFINKEKTLVTKTYQRHKGRQQRSKPSPRSPRLWLQVKLCSSIIILLKLMWISIVKKPTKTGGWKCIGRLPWTLTSCNVVVAVWADTYHWIRSKHPGILTKMQQTSFCTRSWKLVWEKS